MVCSLLPTFMLTAAAVSTVQVAGQNVVNENTVTYWLCTDNTMSSTGAGEGNYNVKFDPSTNQMAREKTA